MMRCSSQQTLHQAVVQQDASVLTVEPPVFATSYPSAVTDEVLEGHDGS